MVHHCRARAEERLLFPGEFDRRAEVDNELVLAVDQQGSDVETIAAVLVLGATDLGAVEGDRRGRIEPIGDEVVTLGAVRCPVEGGAVLPVAVADPGLNVLVGAVEWVVDQASGEEIELHLPRHGRWHVAVGDGLVDRPCGCAQGPGATGGGVEGVDGHDAVLFSEGKIGSVNGAVRAYSLCQSGMFPHLGLFPQSGEVVEADRVIER